jgi:hypothetical protein
VIWIRDGRPVYRWAVRRVDRDAQPTGKRGRPPLAPTPGVGLTQAVQRRHRGRIVSAEVRRVLGEGVDGPDPVHEERWNGVLQDRLNARTRKTPAFAKTVETWDARGILCGFEHNGLRAASGLAGSGGGPAGGTAGSTADAGDGHRVDRPHRVLRGILDLPASPIPNGVTTWEITNGLEEPTVVPMTKGRLEAPFHHRPHPVGAGERIDQVHYAIGPIGKVQQIKDLLPELGEGAGLHTLHHASFF